MSSNSDLCGSRMTVDSCQRTVPNFSYRFTLLVILVNILNASGDVSHCDFNCLHPRRPETEALFNAVGHHERSTNLKEMMDKINVRFIVINIFFLLIIMTFRLHNATVNQYLNILQSYCNCCV
jgi:hypothetical protein